MNIKTRLVPAYSDEFYRRFPNLFADVLTGTKSVSPLTDFGIECGVGWRPLIEKLCKKLEAMIVAMPKDQRKDVVATQCKQKGGAMRFYVSRAATEGMHAAINEVVDESAFVCELCGKSGCSGQCRK